MPANNTGYGLSKAFSQIGATSTSLTSTRYWDPFLDVAGKNLPKSLKSFWNTCLYFMLSNPVLSPVVQKMSTYPVTQPVYDVDDEGTRAKYRGVMEGSMRVRQFLASHNMDYNGFGIGYASVIFPFIKLLKCSKCGFVQPAAQNDYRLEALKFMMRCPKCNKFTEAEVKDRKVMDANGMTLVRWNPQYITVEENPVTGECDYYMRPPVILENAIRTTKRRIINGTPQIIIETIRKKKSMLFNKDFLFVAKRMGPSNQIYRGYGIPVIMPAIKSAYLMQIAQKAMEAIMLEHVLPIRIAFPTEGPNLANMVSLSDLQGFIAEQLKEWRKDQNRILVFPTPTTVQDIGGRGKSLMLSPEIRQMAEMICSACKIPPEFIFGGLSFSGSNVSLRIVENDFLYTHAENEDLLQFIANRIQRFMEWPAIKVRQKPFKMADDLQRAAFDASLTARDILSSSTLLQNRDYDPEYEIGQIAKEVPKYGKIMKARQIAGARAQGAATVIQSQYQVQAGGGMAPPPGQVPPGTEEAVPQDEAVSSMQSPLYNGVMQMNVGEYATYIAQKVGTMKPDHQNSYLQMLKQNAPGLANEVAMLLAQGNAENPDLRPLPGKLPPRRTNSPI